MHAAVTMPYQSPPNTYSEMSAPFQPVFQPVPTHPVLVGYLFWILGFTGAPLLFRQVADRHPVVLHRWVVSDWLDHRFLFDSLDG